MLGGIGNTPDSIRDYTFFILPTTLTHHAEKLQVKQCTDNIGMERLVATDL